MKSDKYMSLPRKGECRVRREKAQNRLLKGMSMLKEWTEDENRDSGIEKE